MERLSEIPVNDWGLLPIEVLKKTYDEVKENMAFHFSEVQSITAKMIQILTIFIPFVSASYLFLIGHHSPITILLIVSLSYCLTICFGIKTVHSHYIHETGLTPQYFLTANFDDKNISEKEKLLYVNLINTYWIKINELASENEKRIKHYDLAVSFAIASFIITGVFIGLIYSHHVYFLF